MRLMSCCPSTVVPCILMTFVLAVAPGAGATETSPAAAEEPAAASEEEKTGVKRISVPSISGAEELPYTIEVPVTWGPRRDLPLPGVLLGPPAGDPNSHPEMVLVRTSEVDASEPGAILETLQANAETADWELLEGEVRDFGGVSGLWIVRELPPSGLHGDRVNMAVKLPFAGGSLDLVATVPKERYSELGPLVQGILASVQAGGE